MRTGRAEPRHRLAACEPCSLIWQLPHTQVQRAAEAGAAGAVVMNYERGDASQDVKVMAVAKQPELRTPIPTVSVSAEGGDALQRAAAGSGEVLLCCGISSLVECLVPVRTVTRGAVSFDVADAPWSSAALHPPSRPRCRRPATARA